MGSKKGWTKDYPVLFCVTDMAMVMSWVGERGMKEDSDRGNPWWMIFLRMTGPKLLRYSGYYLLHDDDWFLV